MPRPSPFHPRTSELCSSWRWKEWAGYLAVSSYDICHEREYQAFRQSAGVLDISPLYKYELTGAGAAELLARVTVRDVARMKDGQVAYTCWCDDDGKVVDDGTLTRFDGERYRLTAAEPSLEWLLRHRVEGVEVTESSESIAALAIQGPRSRALVDAITEGDIGDLRFFRALETRFEGGFEGVVSRTGYTGDLGYELWVAREHALALWDAVLEAGREHGAEPAGLDALDVTRLEAGFLLSGVDYQPSLGCSIEQRKSTPYELGLGWMVKLEREPFVGQRALARHAAEGPQWMLCGLEIDVVAIEELYDRHGLALELHAGASRESVPIYRGRRQVGYATTRAWSPTTKRYLALATLEIDSAAIGTKLEIEASVEHRRERVRATVVEKPFFDPPRKKD